MNMRSTGNFGLEEALARKLESFLSSVSWLRNGHVKRVAEASDRGYDLEAPLVLPWGKTVLAIQCRNELRPSSFEALVGKKAFLSQRPSSVVPVLAMPFVSSRLADLCDQHGWSWYDLAGNCRISVPNAIHLEWRGNEPVHSRVRPKANLSTPEAGRVVRALLAPENTGVRWTQRSMKKHFGSLQNPPIKQPSLGLVNKVIKHLRDEAFLETLPEGGFRLHDPVKLLLAWRDVYRFDRHERRNYFTLLQGKELRNALYNLELEAGGFAAYAAFSAAEFQAPHVRQPKTWLYISSDYIERCEELLETKRVESGDNLIVLIPDDAGVFYFGDGAIVGERRMAGTNPVQTYVDLFHCGGRGEEAAEALLQQKLMPAWAQSHPNE
jgi:hypothetical protein